MMNNNELIKQARELCGEATPGPWKVENGKDVFTELGADNGNGAHAAQNDAWQVADCDPESGTGWCIDLNADGAINWGALKSKSNAAFIAASRTLVPQLCDALEAAQKEIAGLQKQIDTITGGYDYYANRSQQFENAAKEWAAENKRLTSRAEKAAAERDTYKEALSHLEHMVSGERSGNRKREHSIGVMAALCKAREVLKGVE